MRFKKIKFENYRCFLNGEINFPEINKKNMYILIGPNGSGKTETLFAFWWALYDYDFKQLRNKENTPYALNSSLYRKLEQSEEGTTEICSVTLEFENEGTIYNVKKWVEYKKTPKRISEEEYREFSYYLNNGELSLPIRDEKEIETHLNRIIPKSILHGIIFDGERMQKLNTSDENSINAIRGVISDITNVELIKHCEEHYEAIKRTINKELRQNNNRVGNTTLSSIVDKEIELSDKKKDIDVKIHDYEIELENTKNRLESISNQLQRNNEVKEIEKERVREREKLKKLELDLDGYYRDFDATLRFGYLAASNQLLKDVEEIIENYDIPKELTVPAVKSILGRQNCICGRVIDESARKELMQLMSMLPPDNINSMLLEIIRQLRIKKDDFSEMAKKYFDKINQCNLDISQTKEQISSLSSRITSLGSDSVNGDEIVNLENENVNLIKRQGYLEGEIPKLSKDKDICESEIIRLRDQRSSFSESSQSIARLNKEIAYIEKCINALENIEEINKQTALEEINNKLADAYSLLSEDADRGRRIRIIQYQQDKKYRIAVYMNDEYEKLLSKWKKDGIYQEKLNDGLTDSDIEEDAVLRCQDSNSTGQSKINTFSFVKAILDYSNSDKNDDGIEIKKNYPLLIDAPFGDISDENLNKSSKELHNFAKQVILMIDGDKYDSLRKVFDPYVASKYMFIKTDNENNSTIKETKE